MAKRMRRNRNNLTPREQDFCDNYSRYAGNLRMVANAMHISPQSCNNFLQEDRVKEYLGSTLKRSREMLINSTPAIIQNMINLIHNDATPDTVKAQLSIAVLDRAGLQPPKGSVNINVNTLISDRARELLAQRQGMPVSSVPPVLTDINIMEEKQGDLT